MLFIRIFSNCSFFFLKLVVFRVNFCFSFFFFASLRHQNYRTKCIRLIFSNPYVYFLIKFVACVSKRSFLNMNVLQDQKNISIKSFSIKWIFIFDWTVNKRVPNQIISLVSNIFLDKCYFLDWTKECIKKYSKLYFAYIFFDKVIEFRSRGQ